MSEMPKCVSVTTVGGAKFGKTNHQPALYQMHVTKRGRLVWKRRCCVGYSTTSPAKAIREAKEWGVKNDVPYVQGVKQWAAVM